MGTRKTVGREAVHFHVSRECLADAVEACACRHTRERPSGRILRYGNDNERRIDFPERSRRTFPISASAPPRNPSTRMGRRLRGARRTVRALGLCVRPYKRGAEVTAVHLRAPAAEHGVGQRAGVAAFGVFDSDDIGAQSLQALRTRRALGSLARGSTARARLAAARMSRFLQPFISFSRADKSIKQKQALSVRMFGRCAAKTFWQMRTGCFVSLAQKLAQDVAPGMLIGLPSGGIARARIRKAGGVSSRRFAHESGWSCSVWQLAEPEGHQCGARSLPARSRGLFAEQGADVIQLESVIAPICTACTANAWSRVS